MSSQHRRRAPRPNTKRRPLPPLDSPESEVEAKQGAGAVLPKRLTDCSARSEAVIAAVLFALALSIRVWRISYPGAVVFDEVHFLRFVKNYRDGEYLFDIHPPLGKLILTAVSKLFCRYPAEHLRHNGMPFPKDYGYIPMRLTSAFFGALTTPTLFYISRTMGLALPAAILPAIAHATDNLSIVEARVVVMDAQLTFFMAFALLSALRLFGSRPDSAGRRRWLAATSVCAAFAISVKWTTGVTPLLIALVSLTGKPFMRRPLKVAEMAVAGATAIFFYVLFYAIHFQMLPRAGEGDAFMPAEFQQTLLNNTHYIKGARGPGFVSNFIYLNLEMYRANARIKTRHHWESKWYQWVINQRGLLYFDEPKNDLVSRIYLIVNPALGFIALGAVLTTIVLILGVYLPRRFARKIHPYSRLNAFAARGAFLVLGYILNLVPYLEVSRCTFLYHYIPPLFYAQLILANVVDILPPRLRWRTSITMIALLGIAFAVWSPWIYGTPLSRESHKVRQLYGKKWQ